MIYLASYDIEADSLRLKIAKKLLEFGLERIQYSVFLGPLSPTRKEQLKAAVDTLFLKANPSKDRMFMIPLTRQQLKKNTSFGDNLLDMDYLCGDLLVLIL